MTYDQEKEKDWIRNHTADIARSCNDPHCPHKQVVSPFRLLVLEGQLNAACRTVDLANFRPQSFPLHQYDAAYDHRFPKEDMWDEMKREFYYRMSWPLDPTKALPRYYEVWEGLELNPDNLPPAVQLDCNGQRFCFQTRDWLVDHRFFILPGGWWCLRGNLQYVSVAVSFPGWERSETVRFLGGPACLDNGFLQGQTVPTYAEFTFLGIPMRWNFSGGFLTLELKRNDEWAPWSFGSQFFSERESVRRDALETARELEILGHEVA